MEFVNIVVRLPGRWLQIQDSCHAEGLKSLDFLKRSHQFACQIRVCLPSLTPADASGADVVTPSARGLFHPCCSRCPSTALSEAMSPTAAQGTTYHNFIDGAWVPSVSGDLFENRNPANSDDLIGVFQKSTRKDVQQAIEAARRAYSRWRLVPAPRRAEILFRAAQLIVERKESLAREMTREMGKVLDETRGDVQEAIDMTFFMAGEGRRQYGQTVPSELRDKFAMSVRQPLGVCAVITPWNFPMAIPSWKIIPALVCGNTVVFKPATLTPLSALNFVKILEEAGVPPGVVNLVTGGGDEVGHALLVADEVRGVSFTGSTDVGRKGSEQAAPAFKKVHLQMGGKNVIMIMDDAMLDLAVEGCLWGGFGTSGQRCTAASRIVIHEKVYREFLNQ